MFSKCFVSKPAPWLPYQNMEVLKETRCVHYPDREGKTFENPEFEMKIVYDALNYLATDLLYRIKVSDKENKKLTVVLQTPENALYISLTDVLNKFQVSCRNLHVFFTTEYANEKNEVAPITSDYSRARQFMKYFYERLKPELRMPVDQIHPFTTENAARYSDMIDACGGGGADVIYTSVGWSGRIAGIDPVEDFATDDMEKFLTLGSRIITPAEETIAEESMHGMFGCSGDIANVPPKAATIGPRDIAHARYHVEAQYRAPVGATTSWQRSVSRLMLFGEVTPAVPASILRKFPGICFVNADIAVDLSYAEDSDPLIERFH